MKLLLQTIITTIMPETNSLLHKGNIEMIKISVTPHKKFEETIIGAKYCGSILLWLVGSVLYPLIGVNEREYSPENNDNFYLYKYETIGIRVLRRVVGSFSFLSSIPSLNPGQSYATKILFSNFLVREREEIYHFYLSFFRYTNLPTSHPQLGWASDKSSVLNQRYIRLEI